MTDETHTPNDNYDYEKQLCISSFASSELSGRQHYA